MRHRLLFCIFLSFCFLVVLSQDRRTLDSLAAQINLTHQATRHWQDSFIKVQDSLRLLHLQQVSQKALVIKEEKENKAWLLLTGTAITVLVLCIVLYKRFKKKQAT